jgi:hypothetical protein
MLWGDDDCWAHFDILTSSFSGREASHEAVSSRRDCERRCRHGEKI